MDPERIWRIVDNHRLGVPPRKKTSPSLSLSDRLHDLYVDSLQSSTDKNADKRFRSTVNLLARLEKTHVKPTLIVNLYEDEKGYSLMLCPREGGETDEIFLPYEDNEIFSYLDNQEVPPVLMEVLEETKYCHMYNGRVVCEVRDYRCHSVLAGYDRHLLLLRPTSETILATVDELAHQTKCSQEEKLSLEARLLMATQPPLCLETTTEVLCVTNRLYFNQRKFHSPSVRRYLRKRCHAARALMQQAVDGETPERLRVNDLISSDRQPGRKLSNCWKKPKLSLDTSQIDFDAVAREVAKLAKPVVVSREETLTVSLHLTPPTHTTPTRQRSPPVETSSIADELLQDKPTTPKRTTVIQQSTDHTPQPKPTVSPQPRPPPVHPPQVPRPVIVPRPPVRMVHSMMPPLLAPRGMLRAPSPLNPPQMRALGQAEAGKLPSKEALPSGARQTTTLTPPKLKPPPQQTTKTPAPMGMPRLHPLTPETSPASKMKSSSSAVPPTVTKATTTSSPAMPQLHRMPTGLPGAPTVPRLSMPSLKPVVAMVSPRPQSSLHTHLSSPVSTPSHLTPSPLNTTKRPPPPTSENIKLTDTRMPPGLSSLGMSSKSPMKHAQSRSGKLISGTKVKSKKRK